MPTASKAFHALVHSVKAYPAVLNSSEDSNTRLRIPNLQNIPIIFMIMLIVQSPNCKDTQNERERERERRLGTCEVLRMLWDQQFQHPQSRYLHLLPWYFRHFFFHKEWGRIGFGIVMNERILDALWRNLLDLRAFWIVWNLLPWIMCGEE